MSLKAPHNSSEHPDRPTELKKKGRTAKSQTKRGEMSMLKPFLEWKQELKHMDRLPLEFDGCRILHRNSHGRESRDFPRQCSAVKAAQMDFPGCCCREGSGHAVFFFFLLSKWKPTFLAECFQRICLLETKMKHQLCLQQAATSPCWLEACLVTSGAVHSSEGLVCGATPSCVLGCNQIQDLFSWNLDEPGTLIFTQHKVASRGSFGCGASTTAVRESKDGLRSPC
ncbi:uncharacterized protein LOC120751116 isoform X2 [Hirundo rustica]|uniref:uncharacterized protein LOC120751116 isoform X2 n=1 Tax=Hirundo rustica TaxID=43150 RepID=UPI001A941416|nr:uncharacterized protein LOC120751116 isoform X2 [Hirundo rustica]